MKAQTRLKKAVKGYYEAYSKYAQVTLNIPFTAPIPRVLWHPGSHVNDKTGWEIDGKFYSKTAEDLIADYNRQADKWIEKLKRKSDPVPVVEQVAVEAVNIPEDNHGDGQAVQQ
jgi:hypothetical protein